MSEDKKIKVVLLDRASSPTPLKSALLLKICRKSLTA